MTNKQNADVRIIGYVTPAEREALAAAAQADGRTLASFIRAAIREKIEAKS